MEENNDINDDFFEEEDENLSEDDQAYLLEKMLDTLMVFNSHFAQYVRESNPESRTVILSVFIFKFLQKV